MLRAAWQIIGLHLFIVNIAAASTIEFENKR
jgi:hypothetical protein